MKRITQNNKEKSIYILTCIIVVVSLLYSMLPMIIFRGDYIYTIHDGLDGFGGVTQYIHDHGFSLIFNKGIEFSESDLSSYYYVLSYDVYTLLCCVFGFVTGQIINRMIGIVVGFFAMRKLLLVIFQRRTVLQNCCLLIASAIYVVTPIAPNRIIAFSTLPLAVLLFMYLKGKKQFSRMCVLAWLIPLFSIFAAAGVFIIGLWVLFTAYQHIKERRFNLNLWLSILFMSISTVIINRSYFIMAMGDNNRGLLSELNHNSFWKPFVAYLLNGQYHSTALQGFLILEMLIILTIYALIYCLQNKVDISEDFKKCLIIVSGGWILWIVSAFLLAIREAGFRIGVSLIDGFEWGRFIGFMRPMWVVMVMAFVACKPRKMIFNSNVKGAIIGLILEECVWYGLKVIRGNVYVPTLLGFEVLELVAHLALVVFSMLIFTAYRYKQLSIYVLMCVQLIYVMFSSAVYNDTGITLVSKITKDSSDSSITLNEFYAQDLFENIKRDINYQDEYVAAYGYHPSVLQFNGFKTIDRYESVHSMKAQEQFREIIEPALEVYPNAKEYYDGWGGRMYLYGEIGYESTRNKDIGEYPLYVNTDAFRKYGGKYILSRSIISNSEELGIQLINDYDRYNSIYHIYLYEIE